MSPTEFKPIEFVSIEFARRALSKLNIHGPQIRRVVITAQQRLAIVWQDGSWSYVTWPLFNAILAQRGLTFIK